MWRFVATCVRGCPERPAQVVDRHPLVGALNLTTDYCGVGLRRAERRSPARLPDRVDERILRRPRQKPHARGRLQVYWGCSVPIWWDETLGEG